MTKQEDVQKKLAEVIEFYSSIPDGHFPDDIIEELSQYLDALKVNYEDIRARRDNMSIIGDLDYEV